MTTLTRHAGRALRAALVLAAAIGAAACGAPEPPPPDARAVAFAERMQQAHRAGDLRAALALADSADRYALDLPVVNYTRGTIYTALRRYSDADAALSAVLSRDPGYRGAWYGLGHNAFVQERYREALRAYERERALVASLLRDEAARETFAPDALPSLHAQIGRAYAKLGVRDSARIAYDAALALSPDLPVAHAWLSEWYEEAGRQKAAFNHAFKALQEDRDNLDYVYRVGRLYLQQGEATSALPLLWHVVQRAPAHEGALYNLGRALLAIGRADEGQVYLDRVEEAKALQREALLAERAVTLYPRDPERWSELAGLMVRTGELDKAAEAFRAALALDPGDLSVHNDLANLQVARGDTAGAVRHFEAILASDSTFTAAWLNLGILHAASGDPAAARRAWQAVLRHDPDDADAAAYLERLGR